MKRILLPTAALGTIGVLTAMLTAPSAAISTAQFIAAQSAYSPGVACHAPVGTVAARVDAVEAFVRPLHQRNDTQAQMDQALADQLCVLRIDSGAKTPASSAATDVSVHPPTIYWDSNNHDYYSMFLWDWNNYNWQHDASICGNCTKNIGGTDTQIIDFNIPLQMRDWSQSQWGDFYGFGATTSGSACDGGSYGVAFCRFDKGSDNYYSCCGFHYDMNQQHGEVVVDFYHPLSSGCHRLQGFSKFGHTWSSTTVNGVGLGPWSASISWSTSSNRWQVASQPGGLATVC